MWLRSFELEILGVRYDDNMLVLPVQKLAMNYKFLWVFAPCLGDFMFEVDLFYSLVLSI